MGMGRGDSAVRVMGRKPTKIAEFERRLRMIKDFMNGRPVEWEGTEMRSSGRRTRRRSRSTWPATARARSAWPGAWATA